MKIVRVESFEQIPELGIRWKELLERSRDNHIFLTLEWLTTWWKYYSAHRELVLLAIKDDEKVLAIAPLMNSTYKLFGVNLRKIEFIGTPTSDYHSFILTENSPTCVRMFLDYINAYSSVWDCMELNDIPENSETANVLRVLSSSPLKLKERIFNTCPCVTLPDTPEEYFQKLGKSTKRNLRRWEKRLKKEHKVGFKMYNEIGTVEETMNIFFELHQKRWQSESYSGLFVNQTFRDFHSEVAKRFAEKGWLNLCFLTADDEPISCVYALKYEQKICCYLTGFDPTYSKYRVGHLTFMYLIENCIEGGLKEVDFMRGGESYKNHWNPRIRRNIELRAVRGRVIPKIYDWILGSQKLSSLPGKLGKHLSLHKRRNES